MSALVLLSGGLDSTTVLAYARKKNKIVHSLSFDYNQRHRIEVQRAKEIAYDYKVSNRIIKIDLGQFGRSALTDSLLQVPKNEKLEDVSDEIPITYVPARNTIFLSLALAYAEIIQVKQIYLGVNSIDYSGYPDCRPEFVNAFERLANVATKFAVESNRIKIVAPFINMSKREIIQTGLNLGVDYSKTISCYDPDEYGRQCAKCDACLIRLDGFKHLGINDPAQYV